MQTNNQPQPDKRPVQPDTWTDEQLRRDAQATAAALADARADALRSNPELAAFLEAKAVKRP